jgi:hypothetical protein
MPTKQSAGGKSRSAIRLNKFYQPVISMITGCFLLQNHLFSDIVRDCSARDPAVHPNTWENNEHKGGLDFPCHLPYKLTE